MGFFFFFSETLQKLDKITEKTIYYQMMDEKAIFCSVLLAKSRTNTLNQSSEKKI